MTLEARFSTAELQSLQSLYLNSAHTCSTLHSPKGIVLAYAVNSPYCSLLRSKHHFCSEYHQYVTTQTLEQNAPFYATCPGGLGLICLPISSDPHLGVLIASITSPPQNKAKLQQISRLWDVPQPELLEAAYQSKVDKSARDRLRVQAFRLADALGRMAKERDNETINQLLFEGFRAWLDSASAAMMISSEDGQVIFANKPLLGVANLSEVDLLGRLRGSVLSELSAEALPAGETKYLFESDCTKNFMVAEAVPLTTRSGQQLLVDYLKPPGPLPRRLLESSLDLIDMAILIVDRHARLVFANRAAEELFNFSLTKAYGQNISDLTPIPDDELVTLKALREGKTTKTLRAAIVLPHKGPRTLLGSSQVIFEANQVILGVISTFMDMTDIEQEQTRGRSNEKLAVIGQMAAGMAHELRNPITVISGFAQLMLTRVSAEPEATYLHMIIDELKSTIRLLDDFLMLSKPSEPKLNTCKSSTFLAQLRLLIEGQCLLQNVELCMECTGNPVFYGDNEQLKQVFLNLIKNSLEAMTEDRPGKRLLLKSYAEQAQSIFIVEDTGKGMSAEELLNVGTPFYTSKTGGTGLGLSLSYKLVENMGGMLSIESTPGQGTRVTVTLPNAPSLHIT